VKTVKLSDCSIIRMVAGGETRHPIVIHNGCVKEWIGFGWIVLRGATAEDKNTFPVVMEGGGW
jgi:hypothetical protein